MIPTVVRGIRFKVVKGGYICSIMGVIQGDLDYSSYENTGIAKSCEPDISISKGHTNFPY